MNELLWFVALAAIALGLLGIFLPLLPGVALIFGGILLAAWIDDFTRIGVFTLVGVGALAAVAWLLDYVAAIWGVQRAGASGLAMAGAGVGALVGVLGGLPGILLGPVAGAVAGEYLARRDERQASRAGLAAGIAFLLATVAKLAIAVTMIGIFVLAWAF